MRASLPADRPVWPARPLGLPAGATAPGAACVSVRCGRCVADHSPSFRARETSLCRSRAIRRQTNRRGPGFEGQYRSRQGGWREGGAQEAPAGITLPARDCAGQIQGFAVRCRGLMTTLDVKLAPGRVRRRNALRDRAEVGAVVAAELHAIQQFVRGESKQACPTSSHRKTCRSAEQCRATIVRK